MSSWLLLIYLQCISEQDNHQQSKRFSKGIIPAHKLNPEVRKGNEKFVLNIVISSDSPQNVLDVDHSNTETMYIRNSAFRWRLASDFRFAFSLH